MKRVLLLCLWAASLSIATESILGDDVELDTGSSVDKGNYKYVELDLPGTHQGIHLRKRRLECVNPYTACAPDEKFCCPPGVECVDGKCPFEALENAGFVKFGKLVGRDGEVIEIEE